MTNDPSTAITSTTAPAPEVGDSTSKGSNPHPQPTPESGNAPPAPDAPQPSMVRRIGNTIFEVSFHFSTTSRETMSDKIKRMLKNEIQQM